MEQKICIHFQRNFIKSFMDLDRVARYRYTGFLESILSILAMVKRIKIRN